MMDSGFGGGEARQTRTEERPERVDRAAAGFADDGFEFGEAQLDGVEVGTVGRQEAQRRAAASIAWRTPRLCARRGCRQSPCHRAATSVRGSADVGEEAGPVHRAIEDPRRGEPRHPQRGDEGTALPPTLGRVIGDPLAAKAAPIAPQEIGRPRSRKTRRVGSSVGAVVAHCARAAATSDRVRSYGKAQFHGPPNRRQTGGRTPTASSCRERVQPRHRGDFASRRRC